MVVFGNMPMKKMPSGCADSADCHADAYASGVNSETSTWDCQPSFPAASLKALPISAHAGRGQLIMTTEWSPDGALLSGASFGAPGRAWYSSISVFAELTLSALKPDPPEPDPPEEASPPPDELEQAVKNNAAAKIAAPILAVARTSSPRGFRFDGGLRG